MMVFTEAMARMVAGLAEAGGEMEIELHDDHVRIGYSPWKKGGPAGRKPGAAKGGPSGREKLYKARNEATGKVERHTVKEWCRIAGDGISPAAMYQRITKTGVAGTTKHRSKFEKSDMKKRIST